MTQQLDIVYLEKPIELSPRDRRSLASFRRPLVEGLSVTPGHFNLAPMLTLNDVEAMASGTLKHPLPLLLHAQVW